MKISGAETKREKVGHIPKKEKRGEKEGREGEKKYIAQTKAKNKRKRFLKIAPFFSPPPHHNPPYP